MNRSPAISNVVHSVGGPQGEGGAGEEKEKWPWVKKSQESLALRAAQLELRAAQMEHSKK